MVTRLRADDVEAERGGSDSVIQRTLEVVADVFGPAQQRAFTVRLWNGVEECAAAVKPRFVLVLNRPDALRRMLLPATERRVAEAFLSKDVDIEGDLEAATALGETLSQRQRSMPTTARLIHRLIRLPAGRPAPRSGLAQRRMRRWFHGKHSRASDLAAVRHHYDVGNDFYSLWLDDRMVYSCGYFPTGREDVNAAQEAKLELICRKLRLEPRDRLLDIGCGWGGLIIYAAKRYGVRATGITLSRAQAQLARERIAAAGLADRCNVEILDYRDLPTGIEFDKIASVGMVEHVGRAKLPAYFRTAYRVLRPGGLFLNHGIVALGPTTGVPTRRMSRGVGAAARLVRGVLQRRHRPDRGQQRRNSFIQQYVFPDSELLSPAENLAPAEAIGFETRDIESLREHYAHTLRCWRSRLEASQHEAITRVGEPAYRIWRLCLAGTAHAFAAGRIGVIQTLLAKRRDDGTADVARTRTEIYA